MNKTDTVKAIITHCVFWFWNVLFLVVAVAILVPSLVIPIMYSVYSGDSPFSTAVYSVLCVAFPVVCIVAVLWKFRWDVGVIARLFCGFEIPIFFLLLLRIILLRDMNPGLIHLLLNFIVAFCSFFYLVCWPLKHSAANIFQSRLRFSMACLVLMVGGYFALLIMPFAIPLCAEFVKMIFTVNFWHEFGSLLTSPLLLLFCCLIFLTSSLFLASPVLIIYFYVKTFLSEYRMAVSFTSKKVLVSIALLILLVNTALFLGLNQQPQSAVFAALDKLQEEGLEPALFEDKEMAKKALVNAYLGAWRYVSPELKSNAVQESYIHTFGSRDSRIAVGLQNVFNAVAKPFLYQGKAFQADHDKAADYYSKIFDTPIEKAEKESILQSIRVTWERESAAAGLINAASETVLVREQKVDVSVDSGVARVRVLHVLENQTFNQHEVTLHFSLPEDAVLSGLWLSDNESDLEQYPYVLSPRGAAQQVYNNEVSRRVDPSLLEQVGPRQFRLRAFPVPAREHIPSQKNNYFLKAVPSWKVEPLYLSFEYETLPTQQGYWPVPQLLEKRNIYWNENTVRYLNGEPITESAWMPKNLGSVQSSNKHLVVNLGDVTIKATPLVKNSPSVVKNTEKKFALLIDGSYSMINNVEYIQQSLDWLQRSNAHVSIWLCQLECQSTSDAPTKEAFWGNSLVLQQLQAWQAVADVSQYDAVIMLSDEGSYELDDGVTEKLNIETLLLVHLNNQLPYAYSDPLLELLRRGKSGIAESIDEAMTLYALRLELDSQTDKGLQSDLPLTRTKNYAWSVVGDDSLAEGDKVQSLQRIAAHHWINFKASTADNKSISHLDEIHRFAKQFNIVTDYSSMIVLVNERQKKALKEAEEGVDRFDREVEQGSEDISSPTDMFSVASVPEPEEWMLMGIVAIMLAFAYRRRRFRNLPLGTYRTNAHKYCHRL